MNTATSGSWSGILYTLKISQMRSKSAGIVDYHITLNPFKGHLKGCMHYLVPTQEPKLKVAFHHFLLTEY